MYQRLLPALAKIEEKNQLTTKLSAPASFYGNSGEGVLVMEDLRVLGYYLVDKAKG